MERKILVDLSTVMKPKKPYADSTLRNMKKDDLIEYVRVCEYNYDIAVASLNQQAENVKDWAPVVHASWEMVEEKKLDDACEVRRTGRMIPMCTHCRHADPAFKTYFRRCPDCGAVMNEEE